MYVAIDRESYEGDAFILLYLTNSINYY